MLKAYFASIIIWMIIIYSVTTLFERRIKDNGWADKRDGDINEWKALFILSAIPFIRLLVILCCVFMALYTKEQYNEYVEKIKNDKEE